MRIGGTIKSAFRPLVSGIRQTLYQRKFKNNLILLRRQHGNRIASLNSINPGDCLENLWDEMLGNTEIPLNSGSISLADDGLGAKVSRYWSQYSPHYLNVSQPREKGLEHSLTFELLDFARIRRYCDVAAS